MTNLPEIKDDPVQTLVPAASKELETKQAEALATLAEGVKSIANFLSRGGLAQVLSGYARTQAVKDILGGLASHDGRDALDARVLQQNAVEIVEQVERVFAKYSERLSEKNRDPDVHDAEADYSKWKKE